MGAGRTADCVTIHQIQQNTYWCLRQTVRQLPFSNPCLIVDLGNAVLLQSKDSQPTDTETAKEEPYEPASKGDPAT